MQSAANLSWWQKETLRDAAAAHYQQMSVIAVERQAAAAALNKAGCPFAMAGRAMSTDALVCLQPVSWCNAAQAV